MGALSWLMNLGYAATAGEVTPPVVETPSAAHGSRRRRKFIEIDDQLFEVRDAQHAQALLERAREVAVRHAQELAAQTVPATRKVGKKPVRLRTPAISSPDPELAPVIRQARKAINEVYRSAAIEAELTLLLARALDEQDEEDALLLLM